MKKSLLFLSLVGLILWAPAAAKTVIDTDDSAKTASSPGWYLGMGLGIDAPVLNWDTDYPVGGGGDMIFGYRLSPSCSLQLTLNPLFFTGGGLSVCDVRVSPELKLCNPIQNVTPYVLMGPGYDFQFDSPSGYTTSSMAVVLGLGFDFELKPGEHAFIEGRYDFLIYKNITQQDIPILVGLSEDL